MTSPRPLHPLLTFLSLLLPLLCLPLRLSAEVQVHVEALPPLYADNGQGVAAAFVGNADGQLVVVGGYNLVDPTRRDSLGERRYFDNIWHLGRLGWFLGREHLRYPAAYGACVSEGEWVICIGGTNRGGRSLTEVYRLNARRVERLASLPVGIDHASAVLHEGYIYIAGGQTNGLPQSNVYRLRYPDGRDWELYATLPPPARLQPCLVAQTDGVSPCLYVFGGYDPANGSVAEDVLKLDMLTHAWTMLPDAPALVGMAAVACGYSHVLLFGSEGGGEDGGRVEEGSPEAGLLVYHTITNSWYSIPLPSFLARTEAGLTQIGDDLVVAGGANKKGACVGEAAKLRLLPSKVSFGWSDWTLLAFYLVLMLAIGLYFMRRQSTADTFFRGEGRLPGWASGISIYATMISSLTFMAIPAKAYATDWTYYPILVTILLVIPFVTRYYLPRFRSLGLTSAYEYLEARFSLATRLAASALFIVFTLCRMALVLYLPALALSAVTGMDIVLCVLLMGLVTTVYCTMGGVEAVVWSDVIQGIILVGGALLAAVWLFTHTEGGVSRAVSLAIEADKFRLFRLGLDPRGVTFWVAIVGGLAGNLITLTSDQTVVQRYLTTSSTRSAARSLWTNALLCLLASPLFYLIGTGLYTFYKTHPHMLDITMDKADAIVPYFMASQPLGGLAGLLLAAIFAATMSTLSTGINSVSTAVATDFVLRFRPSLSQRALLRVARLTSLACGLVGMGMAFWMAHSDILSLLDSFNTLLGLMGGAVGGLFFLAVFCPRVGGKAALTGLVVATAVVFAVHWLTPVSLFLYGAVGLVVCVAVGWVLSLFTSGFGRG